MEEGREGGTTSQSHHAAQGAEGGARDEPLGRYPPFTRGRSAHNDSGRWMDGGGAQRGSIEASHTKHLTSRRANSSDEAREGSFPCRVPLSLFVSLSLPTSSFIPGCLSRGLCGTPYERERNAGKPTSKEAAVDTQRTAGVALVFSPYVGRLRRRGCATSTPSRPGWPRCASA